MEENEFREHFSRHTNSHHIIPRHVFTVAGLLPDDSKKNKINLLFRDHILAHYYLYKCAKDEKVKSDNYKAVQLLVKYDWENREQELLENLDLYQENYVQN